MGLDNGLLCVNAPKTKEFESFRDVYHQENEIEICYWRKCWDFRNEIISSGLGISCSEVYNKENPKDWIFLTIPQVEEFRDILAKYTDIEYVRENNWGSIWIDEELVDIMKGELERLDKFLMLMKQQPGLKVYFYDSY